MNIDVMIIIITIFFSAFFSGAEVAIVSVSKLKAQHLLSLNKKNSKSLMYLKNHTNKTLITILIGNNVVNVASSALATKISLEYFANQSIGIVTGIMTFILLTFGEITPKTFVANNSERVALVISPIIVFLIKILYPIVFLFEKLSKLINKLFGKHDELPIITEREIKYLVKIGEEEGIINANEKEIIHKTFALNDITVNKIKTPIKNVFSLDWNKKISQVLPEILDQGFSRIPIYDKNPDNIKGIIIIHDILNAMRHKKDYRLKHMMGPVYFISENKKIDFALKELQLRNIHLAVVVDKQKNAEGILTIEDILEEIVGEIFDEADRVENLIHKISDSEWKIKGKTYIRTINKRLNINLSLSKEFKPLSKFLEERLPEIKKGGVYADKKTGVFMRIISCKKSVVTNVFVKKL